MKTEHRPTKNTPVGRSSLAKKLVNNVTVTVTK